MPYTLTRPTLPGQPPITLEATPEQTTIVDFILQTKTNLLINALAGAAKTSTLEFICKYAPPAPILCLAFNKRIATEMQEKLPSHVKCQTLNSLGHRVWMQACSSKIILSDKKTYDILSSKINDLSRRDKTEAFACFADLLKIMKTAKGQGYIPGDLYPHAKRLIPSETFWSTIYENFLDDLPDFVQPLIDAALAESIKQAYSGTIDFDDQIYMPTLFGGTFPRFPLVMVDEAQDLSPLNHEMLLRLVTSRLIAVGDPWQSIYGFRGAVSNGMEHLLKTFTMTELPLSVSFRCPRSIIRRAHSRVPHMQWPDWAEEGNVNEPPSWSTSDIPDGAAIICRNNAPLFKLAFELIRAGRGVQIVGADIGPQLIKTLKKLGDASMDLDASLSAIGAWERERLLKAKGKAAVKDKAECLRVFVSIGGSLAGAIAYAENIFAARGPVQLLSGHKSKGLEWDHVFHLDSWRIPSPYASDGEETEQELNVKYVIETRAKKSLTLINTEDLQ